MDSDDDIDIDESCFEDPEDAHDNDQSEADEDEDEGICASDFGPVDDMEDFEAKMLDTISADDTEEGSDYDHHFVEPFNNDDDFEPENEKNPTDSDEDQPLFRKKNPKKPHQCKLCDKAYGSTSSLEGHINVVHKKVKPFECHICGKAFGHKSHMTNHVHRHTEERSFACDICDSSFKIKADLTQHKRVVHHPSKADKAVKAKKTKIKPTCHVCGKTFCDNRHLEGHINAIHKKLKPFVCDVCDKAFSYKKYLQKHKRDHLGLNAYPCEICAKVLCRPQSLREHMKRVHDPERKGVKEPETHVCDICSLVTKSACNLKAHVAAVHDKKKPFGCETCGKMFATKSQLNVHAPIHNPGFHMCDMCGMAFTQAKYVVLHKMRIHGIGDRKPRERKWPCENCEQSFFREKDLKAHQIAIHDKLKPFQCHLCGKDLAYKSSLEMHLKVTHSDIRNVECTSCDAKFKSKSLLRSHVKAIHNKEKNYECSYCQRQFFLKVNMQNHVTAVHEKRKDFECQVCHKKFGLKVTLNVHFERCHSSKKPEVPCNICGKLFWTQSYAQRHADAVHHDIRAFQCQLCDKAFKQNTKLQRHVETVHKKLKPYACPLCRDCFGRREELQNHAKKVHPGCTFDITRVPDEELAKTRVIGRKPAKRRAKH